MALEEQIWVEVAEPRGFAISLRIGANLKRWEANVQAAYEKALGILEEDLKNKGLTGEHKLLTPANVERGLWANIEGKWKLKGFMFLILGSAKGAGKLEGETRTVSSVQFA